MIAICGSGSLSFDRIAVFGELQIAGLLITSKWFKNKGSVTPNFHYYY